MSAVALVEKTFMEGSSFVVVGALFLLLGQIWALAVLHVSCVVRALWGAALVFPSLPIVLCFSERGMGRSLAFVAVLHAVLMAFYGATLSLTIPKPHAKRSPW